MIIPVMEGCGMTELGSQGKLHTDDRTFETVQRMIMNLLDRLGERHKEGRRGRGHERGVGER